jgi:hypothetical protein
MDRFGHTLLRKNLLFVAPLGGETAAVSGDAPQSPASPAVALAPRGPKAPLVVSGRRVSNAQGSHKSCWRTRALSDPCGRSRGSRRA